MDPRPEASVDEPPPPESSDAPAEPTEQRSQPLSPVSPKPIHYPAPSNIPILEHQLDQHYDIPNDGILSPPNSTAANTTMNQPLRPAQVSSIDETVTTDLNGSIIAALNASSPHSSQSYKPEDAQVTSTEAAQEPSPAMSFNGDQPSTFMMRSLSDNALDGASGNAAAATEGSNSKPAASPALQASATSHTAPPRESSLDAAQSNDHGPEPSAAAAKIDASNIQALLDSIQASNASPAGGLAESLYQNGQESGSAPVHQTAQVPAASNIYKASEERTIGATDSAQGGGGVQNTPINAVPFSANDIARMNEKFGLSNEAGFETNTSGLSQQGGPGSNRRPPELHGGPQQQGSSYYNPGTGTRANEGRQDDDVPWGPDIQKKYDEFLDDERRYVSEGKWENFPVGSRLFIGNLPSERVTKRDIFHVFHNFGKLAQISIKQAYGFVQFLERDACQRAHDLQQGVAIRGKKVNLEISKPQRNRNQNSGQQQGRERGNERGGRNRRSPSPRARDGNRIDSYRGVGRRRSQSPQPQRRGRERSPTRYNDRRRRSRSPYGGRRDSVDDDSDDDLPLPFRAPRDVPDIQIIAIPNLDPSFLRWVEDQFKGAGCNASTLVLNPRLREEAVEKRQLREGVLAILSVDALAQMHRKFKLRVFDRTNPRDVTFNNYVGLDLNYCIGFVQQARERAGRSMAPAQYGIPPPNNGVPVPPPPGAFGHQMYPGGPVPPMPPAPAPHLLQSPGTGPVTDLNAILASIGGQQSQQPPAPGQYAAAGQHQRHGSYGGPPAPPPNFFGNAQQAPRAGAVPPPYAQTNSNMYPSASGQGQGSTNDMSAIMAQLSQYKGGR